MARDTAALCRVLCTLPELSPYLRVVPAQVEAEDDMPQERNGGTRSGGGGDGGAALAACEALTSLACLTDAKLAIVKKHPQVRPTSYLSQLRGMP